MTAIDHPHTAIPPVEEKPLPLIFIVGNSHCGSTLLGYLLSSHPQIVNAGELKTKTWLKNRVCSCGQPVATCSLYGGFFETFNALKKTGVSKLRATSSLRFLWQKKIHPGHQQVHALKTLYSALSQRIKQLYPNAAYIVDTSKSVWMLDAWLHVLPEDQIHILWLQRNNTGTISSFLKRDTSFFPALASVLTNNKVVRKFLRWNQLTYREIHFDRFHEHYAAEAKVMSEFIGMELPSKYEEHGNHHVISGNSITRNDFTKTFKGFRPDDEWKKILRPWQVKLISWLS